MKKSLIAAMGLSMVAFAGTAKEADQLRIYINPGHGSWTPDDRPCTLVGHEEYNRVGTDTTNFFETNTNLRKGFGVLEALRQYGLKFDPTLNQTGERHQIGAARDMANNIVMSHVKCGPYHDDNGTKNQLGDATPADIEYYNRNLTEICQEVDANNFDMFISIHSNAAGEGTTTNYPLFLYRGWDTPTQHDGCDEELQATSRAIADACWAYSFQNPHMMWTNYSLTSKNIRGDVNFYGSGSTSSTLGTYGYLGVLKHHVPGFLVEGYFHTYQPARHRAMNWDVDYMEGLAYAHGIADYFGLKKESTGNIYGIVRDANERFKDTYYKPNTATLDRYLPLNGVDVVLNKDGKEVARVTTDNNYNGAFVFKNVEPGTYTITFDTEQFLPIDPLEVEVKAAEIVYPTAQLVNVDWVPEAVTYVNYPDPMAEVGGVSPAAEYNFAATYTNEIAELEGLNVRRAIVRDGKMYILALDKPVEFTAVVPVEDQPKATILVYDLDGGKVLATVSTEGAAGSRAAIADIQVTADGVLLACNATKNQNTDEEIEEGDAGRGVFNIYKWENDANGLPTGNPAVWIPMTNTGLWFRSYPSMFSYSGTLANGSFVIAQPTISAPNYELRASMGSVIDGEIQPISDNQIKDDRIILGTAGADFSMSVSPLNELELLTFDSVNGVTSSSFDKPLSDRVVGSEALAATDGRTGMFKYAGASYAVVPAADGIKLVNLTNGVDKATETTVNLAEALEAVETASIAAAGEVQVSRDVLTEVINEGWINLYLLRGTSLVKLTTKNVSQPQPMRQYAYDVKAAEVEGGYEVSFKMTGDAPAATVVFTNDHNPDDTFSVDLGAVKAGENTTTVEAANFDPEGYYSWEVQVTGAPIAQAGLVKADPSGLQVRGSVIAISDPEAESFGYVTVGHGCNAGVDVYDAAGNKVSDRLYVNNTLLGGVTTNQSNPIRGDQLDGYAVLATWGDTGYGMVATNPINPSEEPFTLFAGTKSNSGCFTYDGKLLGGGTAGISFLKQDGKIYALSFSEDHENQNGKGATENTLVSYVVNHEADGSYVINDVPNVIGFKSTLANTNVDIVTYGNGVFVSQVRGAGNNQSSVPCFAYIADVITAPDCVMTSADDAIIDYIDNNTSGIAVTTDGKTFAAALTNSIVILSLEWKDGVPAAKYEYSFPVESHTWSTMRFDAAGNLHVYLREGGYRVYSLPAEAPVAVTKAASKYNFGVEKAVEAIAAEAAAAADAVFYNLQGVRVAADALTPGIYVKVSGSQAEKVVIR